jgi:hypothetical protein
MLQTHRVTLEMKAKIPMADQGGGPRHRRPSRLLSPDGDGTFSLRGALDEANQDIRSLPGRR